MCLGLPGSTAIMSLLPAKSCGAPVLPATLSMLPESAVASTSAGAPCCSCVTRSLLPAKSNVTFTSGWAAVNSVAQLREGLGERGRGEDGELAWPLAGRCG